MCGIIGFYKYKPSQVAIQDLTLLLKKRGPDAIGTFEDENVALGHARLSILDLETGDQPMFSDDKNEVLVFNGEIYNFKALRLKLESEGAVFKTSSDTEVIVKGYKAWGFKNLLLQLEGMFAIALWDLQQQQLYIARDRFGEKPFYYYQNEEGFYFSSELKGITALIKNKEIDKAALNLFFSLSYIPAPYTIYEGVYKLEPGNYITLFQDGSSTKENYYATQEVVAASLKNPYDNYEQAKSDLRELLFQSVEQRMVADVPIGSFLSGGIDSSIVSAIMAKVSNQPINTFSIGFHEKEYDESDRAQLVAKHIGSNHTQHMLSVEELLESMDDIIDYFDEPFGDSSAIPSYMVAKKAREKVTVVLTGDCADELFAGYEKYLGNYYIDKFDSLPKIAQKSLSALINTIPHSSYTNQVLRKAKKVIVGASLSEEERYVQLTSLGFSALQKSSLFKKEYKAEVTSVIARHYTEIHSDAITKTLYSDLNLVLEGDMLTKVDRMCMMNSLEARVPFLDSKIVDFAFKLPIEYKLEGSNKKKILKDAFKDLLPEQVFDFSKKGFGLPLRIWFKNELKEELLQLLNEVAIQKQGVFEADFIRKLLEEHMTNKENHSSKLWLLFVFQKWYAKNMIL